MIVNIGLRSSMKRLDIKMHNFIIGPTDTDSISFCKPDGSPFTPQELDALFKEINDISPEFIEWEEDGGDRGVYKSCLALKAKNYILWDGKKKIIKGSAFKTSSKEIALKDMMQEIVECFLHDRMDNIINVYHKYVIEATNPTDIMRWSSKKNASEAVLNCMGYEKYTPEQLKKKEIRPNETNIWDAIKMEELVQAGDRFFLYPAILGSTSTFKTFKNGKTKETKIYKYGFRQAKAWNKEDHDVEQLLKRVYDTLSIFETVLNIDEYTDYSKVRSKEQLKKLLTIE